MKPGTNGRGRQAGQKIINIMTATEQGNGEKQQRSDRVDETPRADGTSGRGHRQRSPANYQWTKTAGRRPRVCAEQNGRLPAIATDENSAIRKRVASHPTARSRDPK